MAKQGAGVRSEVVALAREITAAGTGTALVTNNVAEFREHWRRSIPIDELFHHVVVSSEVGLRKPDPRIFELERVGASDPSRAVFLDDYEGNVAAARRIGIHDIRVTADFAKALDELRALLG